MVNDKKQQAKELYFQTELNKTQIANTLNISRRNLHYWIKEGNWERLKNSAEHLPSILAENCYHIFGHLSEKYLSELRLTNPISRHEADTLHKLVLTIDKLKNRGTLNENMEVFGFFLDGLRKKNAKLANDIAPYVDEYLSERSAVYQRHLAPANFTVMGHIPVPEIDTTEQQKDADDFFYWDNLADEASGAVNYLDLEKVAEERSDVSNGELRKQMETEQEKRNSEQVLRNDFSLID